MRTIQIINGPNLNLLGTREPAIYGSETMESILQELQGCFQHVRLECYQSNIEGELVTAIQEASRYADGIVLNAAAYSHTSVAILDAIRCCPVKVIEVHLSNIHAREDFRHTSIISQACYGTICGFGKLSYKLAVEALLSLSTQ